MEQLILQKKLAQFIVNEVFNTISDEDVLKQLPNGDWTHKGQVLPQGNKNVLKREAQALKKMSMYPILIDELRYHAKIKLEKAETEQDIITSKLLSYFTDVLKSKIDKLESL